MFLNMSILHHLHTALCRDIRDFDGIARSNRVLAKHLYCFEGILVQVLVDQGKLDDYVIPIGKARIVRTGKDVTLIAWSNGMTYALGAGDELAKEGIEAEVIDLRTLLPLDEETILNSVKKTNKVLVVHEDTKTGGIAGEIAALLCEKAFADLDGPLMRVASLDTPVPYAPSLEEYFLPNAKKVFAAAKELARY